MRNREVRITGDGSHTIYVPELDEHYHSIHGAIRESAHVFIDEGLRYHVETTGAHSVRILEVGFGTGLNATLAAQFAEQYRADIYYEGIEPFPLSDEEVAALNYPLSFSSKNAAPLFKAIHSGPWNEIFSVAACFSIKKIHISVEEYRPDDDFHICFFDAFAPAKQPKMWQIDVLKKISALLKNGGIFVTYCAKGQLKRDLKQLGFEVHSIPGPPGKREMVRAIKT